MILKKIKYLIAPLAVVLCLALSMTAFAATNVRVFYKGQEISFDVPPQIISERTMVPLRATIETITGTSMLWDDATKTVTFMANGHTNRHTIGEKIVYVDGVAKYFDSPSLILDSRTLVPVRMIAETSGCKVDWDGTSRFVLITPEASTPPTPTPAPTATPTPTPVEAPAIETVTLSKATINPGDSVDFTIKTNLSTKYVWVETGAGSVSAVLKETAYTYKVWTATVRPYYNVNMVVYANTNQSVTGAAARSQPVNVVSSVSIVSVDADSTNIYAGDAATLTIKTNAAANAVWVEVDNTTVNASYRSLDSYGNEIWTVAVSPRSTQTLKIYANTSKTATSGAVNTTLYVTVSEARRASIISAAASKTSITKGDSVTLTVWTNSTANAVWIEGENQSQMYYSHADSSKNKCWTITVYPSQSGNIPVYASSKTSYSVDDSRSISVSVSNPVEGPVIYSLIVDGSLFEPNDEINVTLTTNSAVTNVDFTASMPYGPELKHRTTYVEINGQRVWSNTFFAPEVPPRGYSMVITGTAYTAGGSSISSETNVGVSPLG